MNSTSFQQSQGVEPETFSLTPQTPVGEQHTHAIEPELLGARPRTARWTNRTVAVRRLLWNLMVGTALVLLFLGRNDLATWDALIQRGVPVTATIHDKDISRGKSTSYHLRYSFYGDDIMCYGTDSVSRDEYEARDIGDTLPITYLPGSEGEKWQRGAATPQRRESRFYTWLLAGFFSVGAFGVGIAAFEYEMRGQMRLLQTGLCAIGRVVSGKITTHKSSKTYSIRYEYSTHRDLHRENLVQVPQAAYEQYTTGNPNFTIIYDEAEGNRSKPYFLLTAAELVGK